MNICPWALNSEIERHYHDTEWGRPLHDETALFEFLILEGAQAGLSWRTILQKREAYRRAFHGFDAERIARYDDGDRARLLDDAGIVRNRLKIEAAIGNARAMLALRAEHGSFDAWLWKWVEDKPLDAQPKTRAEVPARTALSDAISKALAKQGFRFVGSTIVYAFMQATGMVNDHLADCPARHAEPGAGTN